MQIPSLEERNNLQGQSYSPYWSDYYNSTHNSYYEICRNKPNLVITLGDSWTWGDCLGFTDASIGRDDIESRKTQVYGRHLSDQLNADFINISYPGSFNYWLHNRLQILLDYSIDKMSSSYDKVYIIITLTEVGRDFISELSPKFFIDSFEKFYNCSDDPEFSTGKILQQLEKFDFVLLDAIQKQLPFNVKLIVGRNFTTINKDNQSILKNLLPKIWTELLFEKQKFPILDNIPLMSMGLDCFEQYIRSKNLNSEQHKKYMVDVIFPAVKQQFDLLDKSVYNHKKATRHPTAEGHKIWADYIYAYIQQHKL
jgi:hypothetical protein